MAKPKEVKQIQAHEVDQELKDRGYDVDWKQRLGGTKRLGVLTTVYKIKESVNSNRETLAIKEIILDKAFKFYNYLYKHPQRELEIMEKLKSRNNKNIIKLIDHIEFEVEKKEWKVRTVKYRHIYFIMEYCDMSLQGYLEKYGGRLNPEEMKVFFRQIRNGLEALHEDEKMKILHRDLKPDNILLKMDGVGIKEGDDETAKRKKCLKATLKMTDFGLSKICKETDTCIIGTPMYMAPEVLFERDDCYDSNADMWCVGIMLYRCLTGRLPYPTQTLKETLKEYFESIKDKESLVDDDLRPIRPTNSDENEFLRLNNESEWKNKRQELSEWKCLIKKLLKIQILDRMNFETFKKHPFVYNLIEGEIKLYSRSFSFNVTKKSAIQQNSHIDEDHPKSHIDEIDPNFFRHCMVEQFSLYNSSIGIDKNLQLIKEKFDGKLLVQNLRIVQGDPTPSVFSWVEKLPEVFEFAEYSTLSLRVCEESFNYIVNNPSSIRFEWIKSINVECMGPPEVYQVRYENIVEILNFVFNQENGENRECLVYNKNFNYNLLQKFIQKFCKLFETNSQPECIFKEVSLKGKKIYKHSCNVESPVKWHEFLENLGFINVGLDFHGYNTKIITTVHEKSRTNGWKLRILWSEDIQITGFHAKETRFLTSLTLKISKEFLRPIKEGYFVLNRSGNGNVYVGDEKLIKIGGSGRDDFMIMPLSNYKRYRFENVVIGWGVEVEKLHEWVKQRGEVIPVVNLYLEVDTLRDTTYISTHSLPKFEFYMLELTLSCHSDFDELAKNPRVLYFPRAKSININVTTRFSRRIEPSREYDKFLNFIFNNDECINLDKIHFGVNIIDFTEEFVKEFIERFKSTTNLEYAWKSVLIDDVWDQDKEKYTLQSITCRNFSKMINDWDNFLNSHDFRPSDDEINEEYIGRGTVRLLLKPHVLTAKDGWKLKILSSDLNLFGMEYYFWEFQIYK